MVRIYGKVRWEIAHTFTNLLELLVVIHGDEAIEKDRWKNLGKTTGKPLESEAAREFKGSQERAKGQEVKAAGKVVMSRLKSRLKSRSKSKSISKSKSKSIEVGYRSHRR